jgi:phosphoserine phosphatase/SAM-dependent methyltransferase
MKDRRVEEIYTEERVKNYGHSRGKRLLLFPAVIRQIPKAKQGKLLDVGCGLGDFYPIAQRKGYKYYGIDLSSDMINWAEDKFPRGYFKVADATSFSHHYNEKFNVILSVMLFPNFSKKKMMLKSLIEMEKVLSSGGKIVLGVIHPCFDPYMQKYLFKNANVETEFEGYFSSGKVFFVRKKFNNGVMLFNDHHWTINDYVSAINKAGLRISVFEECKILSPKIIKWSRTFTKQRTLIPTYMTMTCVKENNHVSNRYKMIVFDMDRILIDVRDYKKIHKSKKVNVSSWLAVYQSLGILRETKIIREKFEKGIFPSYMEWTEAACNLLKKHNLTRNKFYQIINNQRFVEGAIETIRELKNRGFKVAVITGSFTKLAERTKKELNIDAIVAHCDLRFDKKGKLQNWKLNHCDFDEKIDALIRLTKKYKVKTTECVYVGDEIIDIPLFQKVGLSIAFNSRKNLARKAANVTIDKFDLRSILPLL